MELFVVFFLLGLQGKQMLLDRHSDDTHRLGGTDVDAFVLPRTRYYF